MTSGRNDAVQVIPGNGPVGPADIVVSYAHEDEEFVTELRSHLAVLRRSGDISWWHDREILAGTDIDAEIDRMFRTAEVILFIVSAHFLDSDYCYGVEVQRAMERYANADAIVIPVIARVCQWDETPFARLSALPTDAKPIETFGNRNEAFKDIADNLRKVIRARKPKPVVTGDETYTQTSLVALRTNALLKRPVAPLASRRLVVLAPDYVYKDRVFLVTILATDATGAVSVPSGIVFDVRIDGGEFVPFADEGWAASDAVLVVAQGDGKTADLHARASADGGGRITVSSDGYGEVSTDFVVIPEHQIAEVFRRANEAR